MIIDIASDLHIDYNLSKGLSLNYFKQLFNDDLSKKDSVLILAGDIYQVNTIDNLKKDLNEFLNHVSKLYKVVFYIMGNHEYYGNDFCETLSTGYPYTLLTLPDNVKIISKNTMCKLFGVDVLFSTLWSNLSNEDTNYINDFIFINNFTFENYITEYTNNINYIKTYIDNHDSNKHIIVTHHAPSLKSIHSKYETFKGNSAFVSDCEYLMNDDMLMWIHGHTHTNFDYNIGNTKVVCNPHGYFKENTSYKVKRIFIINKIKYKTIKE